MPPPLKIRVERIAARAMGEMTIRILPTIGKLRRATLAHVRIPPRVSLPAVRHRKTDELAYILSGSGSGVVGGRRVRFKKGDALLIPAGAVHRFQAGAAGTEILDIFVPVMDWCEPDVIWEKGSG